jgi:hypothetical protein
MHRPYFKQNLALTVIELLLTYDICDMQAVFMCTGSPLTYDTLYVENSRVRK